MIGLHPCSVKENYLSEIELLYHDIKQHDFVAIGEVGIDLYWDKSFFEQQKHAFKLQINFGKKQPCLALTRCCLNRACSRNMQAKPRQPMADPRRTAVSASPRHPDILWFCGLPGLGRLTNQTYLCTLRPMTGDDIKAATTNCLN